MYRLIKIDCLLHAFDTSLLFFNDNKKKNVTTDKSFLNITHKELTKAQFCDEIKNATKLRRIRDFIFHI